jgi:hypothetical protein
VLFEQIGHDLALAARISKSPYLHCEFDPDSIVTRDEVATLLRTFPEDLVRAPAMRTSRTDKNYLVSHLNVFDCGRWATPLADLPPVWRPLQRYLVGPDYSAMIRQVLRRPGRVLQGDAWRDAELAAQPDAQRMEGGQGLVAPPGLVQRRHLVAAQGPVIRVTRRSPRAKRAGSGLLVPAKTLRVRGEGFEAHVGPPLIQVLGVLDRARLEVLADQGELGPVLLRLPVAYLDSVLEIGQLI